MQAPVLWGHQVMIAMESTHRVFPSLFLRLWSLSTGNRCSVTRLGGEVDVHVFTVSPAQQSTTQEGEVSNSPPWWPSQPWFPHLLHLCVHHHRFILYRQDLSQQGYVLNGKSYHLHAWRLSCRTTKQQDFQKRQQQLEDPQQTECTTTGRFALLTGPQNKELICLVPQLLK